MTFELLLKPITAEKKPWTMFIFAFLVSSLAIVLSINIFPDSASVLLVTFTIIPIIPIVVKIIEDEEQEFEKNHWYRLKNYDIIKTYTYLFIGLVISFSLWNAFLPHEASNKIFLEQKKSLEDIGITSSLSTGESIAVKVCNPNIIHMELKEIEDCYVRDFYNDGTDEYILTIEGKDYVYKTNSQKIVPYKPYLMQFYFLHNLKVMLIIFLTSFIFGSGALFILTWNASIIGVFIGEVSRSIAIGKFSAYFAALPLTLGRFIFHGIPEFLAFFIAALSGGIISVAIIRHNPKDKKFRKVLFDSLTLLSLAIIFVFVAAAIEAH